MLTQAQKDCQLSLESCDSCLILKSIRSGKTYCILDYATNKKYKNILWVVPFTDNITGVQDEMKKWKIKLSHIEIICYASLKKYKEKSYDLVVLDEYQRITLPYYEVLKTMTYNKLIAMTGTLPTSYIKRDITANLNLNLVFKYTVKDAVRDENVAPYEINIITKELDKSRIIPVQYVDKKTKETKSFLTSEFHNYNSLIKRIDLSFDSRKRMLMFNMLRFINTLPSTISFIKNYIYANKSKRFLIFVASQQMAEQCSEYCYYGGKSDKYFKLFQEGKINHLVLVEKATVGVTYENLDQVLLTNINSSEASVQQKIFRAILFRPNYTAKIDILINKHTIQEKWIENSIRNII